MTLITSTYERDLAYAYHQIDNRGLLIDTKKLQDVRSVVQKELDSNCNFLSTLWSLPIYIGIDNKPRDVDGKVIKDTLNLNAKKKVLESLKELGYKVPKVRKKDEDTHEYEFVESVNELALQKLFADPSLWPSPESGEGIKVLLKTIELVTFRNRYVNARLLNDIYYSNYNVAGTVTGRRGSKKTIFGLGGNAQNFPARGNLSDLWKECIISRPGTIFIFVDQMQAEDWPVQALAQNSTALDEMRQSINRHYKFASAIFGKPIDVLRAGRKNHDPECEMEYYLGKKGRHSNNYGMQPTRMSESLAGEGYSIPADMCKNILDIINKVDPNVKAIFHQYIQECIFNTRKLSTPLGRERQFFGLHTNDKNYAILNEAYSYIPQSTVGDNTGLSVLGIERAYNFRSHIIQEGHDSICQEVNDNETELIKCFETTRKAFNRTIRFHNGIEIEIPIEGKLGYNWRDTITINEKAEDFTVENLLVAYKKLHELFPRNEINNAAAPEKALAG